MHVVLKDGLDFLPVAAENCLVVREHPSICQVNKKKYHEHETCSRMLESPPKMSSYFICLKYAKKIIQIGYINCFLLGIKTFRFRDPPF